MSLRDCQALLARGTRDYQWRRVSGPIPLEHYQAALGSLADRARGVPGLLGMYDLGPIRYPGLSDLDVLFAVEDDFADFESLRPLLRAAQPDMYHNVVLHDPYFVRRGELDRLFAFAPIFQYRAIWTTEGLPQTGAIDDPADLALFLADIIAESYPREFIQFLLEPVIDERTLLGRLKGLAYCFDLLARLGGGREEAFAHYGAQITELRSDFFGMSEDERAARALRLAQTAVTLSHQLARAAADLLSTLWGLRVQGRLDLFCAGNPAIFTERLPPQPVFGTVHLWRGEVYTAAPAIFGWLVREYARGEGPFSARLRSRMTDGLRLATPPPAEVAATIGRRAALRNRHTAWIGQSGLGLAGFLTFGYRARRRLTGLDALKESAGRLAERLRETMLRRRMSADVIAAAIDRE